MSLLILILTGGIGGAISGGVITYLAQRRLEDRRRFMDSRKDIYSKLNELFTCLFDTAHPAERLTATSEILKHYRSVQIWGSDEVLQKFTRFLSIIDLKNQYPQSEIDVAYKELIIVMRRDLLGKSNFFPEEITVYGKMS